MDKNLIKKEGQRLVSNIKKFLTSKDLLSFLFFLFVSSSLWVLRAMKDKYETMVTIPIQYVKLPNELIITNELPEELHLTIVGQGTNLIKYRWGNKFYPIKVDLSKTQEGSTSISSTTLMNEIQKQIKAEVSVTKINPNTIPISLEKQAEKKLNVKINGSFELAQQYTYCDSILIEPNVITAYGSENALNDLMVAETNEIIQNNIKDTFKLDVKLKSIPYILFSDSIIHLTFKTERFTEKTLQAPISITNLPKDRELKIFPTNVSVSFNVGLSHYEQIDASSFTFSVDYSDAVKKEKKLKIKIKDAPESVFGIKLNPENIDYIIEEKILQE